MAGNFDVNALKEAAGGGDGANAGAGDAGTEQNQNQSSSQGQGAEGAKVDQVAGAAAGATPPPENETAEQKTAREAAEKTAADAAAAAGAGAETPEQKTARELAEKTAADKLASDKIAKDTMDAFFKKHGISSEDELAEKLKPKVEETAEQKELNVQKRNLAVSEYAVTNKILTLDEIKKFEEVSKAPDETLALARFSQLFKLQKPDATPDEITTEYKLFYHLDSEVESLKKSGLELIKQTAEAVRTSLKSKMEQAEADYTEVENKKAKVPAYKKVIKESIATHIPEQLTLSVAEGKEVVYKIPEADREAIEKLLVSEETFQAFLKDGNSQATKDLLKDKIDGLLFLRNRDKMLSTAYAAGQNAGTKDGSDTGASESFANGTGQQAAVVEIKASDDYKPEDLEKLSRVMGGRR